VEAKESAGNREHLVHVLEDRLKSDLGIRVTVELVAPGSLAPFTYGREGKARRLLDKRSAK
jgi:phenylacetate-coenzyme A ligase PaaK-like adenylate-forming protein